ncbi:oxygen-independent coproporphyrinogen III oxidase [Pigmentibacter sp. JX0631]|uniref:oxygen-independent coproporphyrinogen III oxidase n=1 Tax=Pigmentibacter sp. JX0631 TaxID=2976982 RepID=UPI002468EC62|nr:oxygen-independent coproporphyrinogen III oxidase [Pigmentibacter sp. JX0631]WGL59710.1 oxygen-independent coproporphyrinogen III oxidase [Pigmentibacter sp. JX0631]
MLPNEELFFKYDLPVPRYTSYPPYPYWKKIFTQEEFLNTYNANFLTKNEIEISLYIHLPFCESLCYFCGCNKVITKNHELEIPYINKLLIEIDNYLNIFKRPIKLKELHLGGGTPTFFSPSNLKLLFSEIFKRIEISNNRDFSVEVHPKVTNKEHFDVLKEYSFERLSIGVQDFNPDVQKIIGREQTYNDIEFCTQYARKIGFKSVNFDLIYGLPEQNPESILATLSTVYKLKPDRIAFYSYAHVPQLKPSQSKLSKTSLPSGKEKHLIYKTAFDSLTNNSYFSLGFDHFALNTDSLYQSALQGKLHRNFMGFTTQNSSILLGIGVSAISDFGLFYVQNKKSFSEYMELTRNESFNFESGYIMNETDLVIKQHILNLACYHKTSFQHFPLDVNLKEKIIENLIPYKIDKLIELDNETIQVTPLGLVFLRNICSTFDQFTELKKNTSYSQSI